MIGPTGIRDHTWHIECCQFPKKMFKVHALFLLNCIHFCINYMHFYKDCVHLYSKKMCALLQTVCVFLYKKNIYIIFRKCTFTKKNFIHFCINCMHFYTNCVHLYSNKNVCTVTKSVCIFIQKVCIIFFLTYLQSLIKILPLQYQNAFYAPGCFHRRTARRLLSGILNELGWPHLSQNMKFRQIGHTTSQYGQSFPPKTISSWNGPVFAEAPQLAVF